MFPSGKDLSNPLVLVPSPLDVYERLICLRLNEHHECISVFEIRLGYFIARLAGLDSHISVPKAQRLGKHPFDVLGEDP